MIDLLSTMDDEHYPTEETERIIREYHGPVDELLAAVKTVWAYADSGYWDEGDALDFLDRPVHRYHVSTAGWSGNESLLDALEDNRGFWMFFWFQSQRGGHYIFETNEHMKTVIEWPKSTVDATAP